MKENELIKVENEIGTDKGIISVNIDNIPRIVADKIEYISKLEKEVANSEASAKKAMNYVNSQMTRYEEKGKWIFKHRSGNTKDIIEDTQEAIDQLAEAQQVSTVALRRSFEFQKQLADTAKYLFELGCANITVNRTAVQAIEKKLNGASKEEISELAYQEMQNVVLQLKNQEDILTRQERLTTQVIDNTNRLDEKDIVDNTQTEQIKALGKENTEQNKKINVINDTLSEKERIDAEQSQRLEELTAMLENKDVIDEKQEIAITENSKAIKVLFEYTKQKDELDKKQSAEIEVLKRSTQRKLCIFGIIISIISLICSITSIILQLLK